MSSNRPFFSNFLAAFRAHSAALPKTSASLSTTSSAAAAAAAASSQTVWSSPPSTAGASSTQQASPNAASSPRAIHPKSVSHQPSQQAQQQQQQPHPPTLSPLQHNVSPLTHGPRSPPSSATQTTTGTPVYGPPNRPSPSYPTAQEARRNRRGSDSSSEGGYRDVLSAEKWYVGGRTPAGEERFYKLSMVRRDRSADRLSADRLSL